MGEAVQPIVERMETRDLLFPENYEIFKQLATGHLKQRENIGRSPVLEARFPQRFIGKDGNTKVEVQFRGPKSEAESDTLKVGKGELAQEVKVVARIWLTEKGNEEAGKGNAVCYKLGEDGTWYKQTANTYKYDTSENTNYWKLGEVKTVDRIEEQIELSSRISKLQILQKKVA
jgi:hypothetical protein